MLSMMFEEVGHVSFIPLTFIGDAKFGTHFLGSCITLLIVLLYSFIL